MELKTRKAEEEKKGFAMADDGMDTNARDSALELVVFDIEGQRYGLRVAVVDRVLPMVAVSSLPRAPAVALGVINLHGEILPVLDLRRRFGLSPREYGLTAQLPVVRTIRRILAGC